MSWVLLLFAAVWKAGVGEQTVVCWPWIGADVAHVRHRPPALNEERVRRGHLGIAPALRPCWCVCDVYVTERVFKNFAERGREKRKKNVALLFEFQNRDQQMERRKGKGGME